MLLQAYLKKILLFVILKMLFFKEVQSRFRSCQHTTLCKISCEDVPGRLFLKVS